MTDPTTKRGQDSPLPSVERQDVSSGSEEHADGLAPTAAPSKPPTPSFASARISGPGGQQISAPPAVWTGHTIGDRWEVKQRIGIGGMASVHEGVDLRLGRPVAVKILHPHVAENPDSRERLAREARAIAQLKHENVIEVYDYSSDDENCTWLVTELIDGSSLRQIVDRVERPMPEVAVMIVTEVVRALRAAHTIGIVHRDVKPDNILVGKAGRPKLSDFGIAQVVNETRMTLTGNLVGSPSYMSPEQANGKRTDHRTDLFSAGILLYRLVCGTLPFRGTTAIETIRKVSIGEFTDPVELEAGCQGAVAGIIRRALAIDIAERYQTADEMLSDLSAVLQDTGLSATWDELPKFFADPSGYQKALKPRLAKELEARGQALLNAGEEGRAVDCFNRSLSLGEGNQRTMDIVRELSKRRGKGRVRRFVWAAAAAVGAIAVFGVVYAKVREEPVETSPVHQQLAVVDRVQETVTAPREVADPVVPVAEKTIEATSSENEPELGNDDWQPTTPLEQEKRAKKGRRDREKKEAVAQKEPEKVAEKKTTMIAAGLPPVEEKKPEPESVPETRALYGTLQIGGNVWFDVYVDGKKLGRAPDQSKYPLVPGVHKIRAVKPDCDPVEEELTIEPGKVSRLKLKIECH